MRKLVCDTCRAVVAPLTPEDKITMPIATNCATPAIAEASRCAIMPHAVIRRTANTVRFAAFSFAALLAWFNIGVCIPA